MKTIIKLIFWFVLLVITCAFRFGGPEGLSPFEADNWQVYCTIAVFLGYTIWMVKSIYDDYKRKKWYNS